MRYRVHVHPRFRRLANVVFPNWLAITLGGHIWAWRKLGAAELAHELKHVEQWRRLGWRYPFSYWLSSIRAVRAGGNWYRDNEFEREAREAAEAAELAANGPAVAEPSPGATA